MIKSDFSLEDGLRSDGYGFIIGIDEAGRGPLAGPVVAGAAVLKQFQHDTAEEWDLVRDSKTLSERQRDKAFDFVVEKFHIGVGICDHGTIDRINILEASFLAMKKAVADLRKNMKNCHSRPLRKSSGETSKSGNLVERSSDWIPAFAMMTEERSIVVLDGNKEIPNFSQEQKAIIGGDKLVKSISAASIIAKVTRDRMMLEFHEIYPEYGFDRHKGYGTREHMEQLSIHGPSEIHRRSFAPVARLVKRRIR